MAIKKVMIDTETSTDDTVHRQLFRYSSQKGRKITLPFPLPSELVHQILSYLGRDSLWDFAAASTSCYVLSFPSLYSRMALGSDKHRVHLGEYDGVRETNGYHRIEKKKLAKALGWEDCEDLRMDLHMLELGKDCLSDVVKAVHFKSPGTSGPLVDRTFHFLGAMSNLRCLSLYQPLLAYQYQEVLIDGQLRLRTGAHDILESLAHLKTLRHLELDVRPCHIGGTGYPLPDVPLAGVSASFPSFTSLSLKYKVENYGSGWSRRGSDLSALLVSLFLTGLLSSSRETVRQLKIDVHAFQLKHDPYPYSSLQDAEAHLDFDLGRLVGPQLSVFDYRAMMRQPDPISPTSARGTCSKQATDFVNVCGWFPRLQQLRIAERYCAHNAERGHSEVFTASPFELDTFEYNLDATWELRDLEVLDFFQRRCPAEDNIETQPDYTYFGSLLPSRSPLRSPLPETGRDRDYPHSPSDETEFEEETRMLRQILLAQEASRALSLRLPKLKEVHWRANDHFSSCSGRFCWFTLRGGEVLEAGSPGLRRSDRLSYRNVRRDSEPGNGHLYLVNMFGTRKGSF